MINSDHRNPGNTGVASLAHIRSIDVSVILTGGNSAVMTARAGTQDLGMIHPGRRYPVNRVVAGLANRRR